MTSKESHLRKGAKIDNQLNQVVLHGFKAVEHDLYAAMLVRAAEENTRRIHMSFDYLRELLRWDGHHDDERIAVELESMLDKLQGCVIELRTESSVAKFTIFPTYFIDRKTHTMSYAVNADFVPYLNSLTKNWTYLDVHTMSELHSKYSKKAFYFISQYRNTGKWVIDIDTFCDLLEVPVSVRKKPENLKTSVLDRIQKDFDEVLPELHLKITREKDYYELKDGSRSKRKKYVRLVFTFKRSRARSDEEKSMITQKSRAKDYQHGDDSIRLTNEEYRTPEARDRRQREATEARNVFVDATASDAVYNAVYKQLADVDPSFLDTAIYEALSLTNNNVPRSIQIVLDRFSKQ